MNKWHDEEAMEKAIEAWNKRIGEDGIEGLNDDVGQTQESV